MSHLKIIATPPVVLGGHAADGAGPGAGPGGPGGNGPWGSSFHDTGCTVRVFGANWYLSHGEGFWVEAQATEMRTAQQASISEAHIYF